MKVTHADLQSMKYLELVIKESMRLYPPVPIIGRQIPTDTKFGNSAQISSFLITCRTFRRQTSTQRRFTDNIFIWDSQRGEIF
jgi:hypothetical protein